MRKSQFYINKSLAKYDLIALGKIASKLTRNNNKNYKKSENQLTEKQKIILYNHDKDLHRQLSRFSPYSDVKTNLIKQIEIMENRGKRVAKKIKDINSYISYDLGIFDVYYYGMLITTPNYKFNINDNGEVIVTNRNGRNPFKRYRHAINRLNGYLRAIHSPVRIIISSIEHTYSKDNYVDPFNVHAHLLIASSGTPLKVSIGRDGLNQFERYLSKYMDDTPNVNVTPIHNRKTGHDVIVNRYSKPSDLDAITGYVKYITKQKKLPIAKTYEDVNGFKSLPLSRQRDLLLATLNSTNGVTMYSHCDYEAFINDLNQLAYVIAFIAKYHVLEAEYAVNLSLFDIKSISRQGMTYGRKVSNHDGSTKEATFRFNGLNRYTGRPLETHKRHTSNQGRAHYSHHKVDVTPTKYNDGQLNTSSHKVDKTLKMNQNHVDKQTSLNNQEVNTS